MPEVESTTTEKKMESPTKGSPTKKEIDIATQALNHFAQGKRHLLVNDIPSAVNSLQEACRLLAEQYGELAPECGDAYFYYGRALLEMARLESGVLGNALDGEEGSTEGEDEDDNDGEEDNEDEDEEKSDSQSQEEGSQEEGEKTDEDEDVSNLQLAWEMLELAKCIFQKQTEGNPDMALKVAQVHLKLGELSLENESYAQSVEDLTRCLDIQKKILEPDNRCLAESHYQLGVAHSFSDEFDKAIESFNSSISVIEERKVNLVKKIEEKKSWTEEQRTKDAAEKPDPFYTEQGEIDELNQLVPDIKEKVVDMEEMKKDSRERIAKITKNMGLGKVLGSPSSAGTSGTSSGTSSVGFGSTSAFGTSTEAKPVEAKPVSNIGHLIRKKTASECGGGPSNVAVGAVTAALLRKPEEEAGDTSKKSRAEDGTARNGLGSTSDTSNGVSIEKMESEQEKPRSTSAVEEPKKEEEK